jgi:hypothetical protein
MSRTVIYSDLTKRIAWDKARQNGCLDDYTFAVSQSLWTWKMDYDDVEQHYNDIINDAAGIYTENIKMHSLLGKHASTPIMRSESMLISFTIN